MLEKELDFKNRLVEIKNILEDILPFVPVEKQEDIKKAMRIATINEAAPRRIKRGQIIE